MTQHGGAVTQRLDFVEFVADVENAATFGGQLTQGDEEFFDRLRREYRGWLIHDKQLWILQQAAHDFDALALAHRQIMHQSLWGDRQAVVFGHLFDALGQRAHTNFFVHCQRDIFDHSQGFKQGKMLEHHTDTERACLRRGFDLDFLPIPNDFTRIRLSHAVDHFHQRGFTRAVLAQYGVDFTRRDGKADVVIGAHGAVDFGHAV